MSELDPQRLRRELLLKTGINQQLDELVRRANTTAALLKGKAKMEESQLRNLLNTAVESRSVEVVVNFIRYQIARSVKDNTWGIGPDDFGHTVIRDLSSMVRACATRATDYVRGQMDVPPDDETLFGDAYVRLMQLYLGYLNRSFYFGKKTQDFDTLKEAADAR